MAEAIESRWRCPTAHTKRVVSLRPSQAKTAERLCDSSVRLGPSRIVDSQQCLVDVG
jgi:hypothetical protein